MKHNPEDIYRETGKADSAWALVWGWRLFFWTVVAYFVVLGITTCG
jgi:hypothetical protein